MRHFTMGRIADSNGTRKPPRWFISLCLVARGTRLPATEWSWLLNICNLRFWQSVNYRFPFRTLRTHWLIVFTNSLLQFVSMALRNYGFAFLNTWSSWKFDFKRFIVHRSKKSLGDIRPERHWFALFGVHWQRQERKLISVPDVLQSNHVFCV